MTPAQLQTLKTAIAADGALSVLPNNSDGNTLIAAAFNTVVPAFIVWRTDIKSSEIVAACVGAEVATLTAQKQFALSFLLQPGIVDGSSPNVQADFGAIFSAGATLTALAAVAKRSAKRGEQLYATGTGTTASPATMVIVGDIAVQDVSSARNLP